jgi:hypothetical protein
MRFPRLPPAHGWPDSPFIDCVEIGELFRHKENRVKFWPEVKKRLKDIGVKL